MTDNFFDLLDKSKYSPKTKGDELLVNLFESYVKETNSIIVTDSLYKSLVNYLDNMNSKPKVSKGLHTKDLRTLNSLITDFIDKKSSLNILSCIRVCKLKNLLYFYGMDSTNMFRLEIKTELSMDNEDFDILVSSDKLKKFLPKDFCEVKLENNKLFFDDVEIEISSEPISKFPDISNVIQLTNYDFTVSNKAFSKVAHAISTNESRRFATGVNFDKNYLVSTDGKRLVRYDMKTDTTLTNKIMSIKPVNFLSKDERQVNISFIDNKFNIHSDNVVIISNELEANFPPYDAVIPKDELSFHNVYINKKEIMLINKYITEYIDKKNNKIIIDKYSIKIIKDDVTIYEKSLDCLKDNLFKFAVNYNYLKESLSAIESDILELKIKDAQYTLLIKDRKDDNYIEVLMPMIV